MLKCDIKVNTEKGKDIFQISNQAHDEKTINICEADKILEKRWGNSTETRKAGGVLRLVKKLVALKFANSAKIYVSEWKCGDMEGKPEIQTTTQDIKCLIDWNEEAMKKPVPLDILRSIFAKDVRSKTGGTIAASFFEAHSMLENRLLPPA